MPEQSKDKIANPEAHFDKPKDVVQDNTLSRDEKKKALNTWEQDERQQMTASNEGMPAKDEGIRKDDQNCLDEIVRAEDEIGEKPKQNRLSRPCRLEGTSGAAKVRSGSAPDPSATADG